MTGSDPGVAARPVPVVDDPDTGGFFAAAGRGELAVHFCRSCDQTLHLPKAYCHHCGSWAGEWRTVRGVGTLHSWTVVEHQVHPAFPVPYTLVLVDLDDHPGVRFVSDLPGRPDLRMGMAMRTTFDADRGVVAPRWVPAADER